MILKKIAELPDKRLRIFAFILMGMAATDSFLGLVTYFCGQKVLGASFVILAAGFGGIALPLLLNGYHSIARISVMYFAGVVLFPLASYYGRGMNIQFTILIGAIYPFAVFTTKERWQQVVTLIVPPVWFLLLEASEYQAMDIWFGGNSHLNDANSFSRLSMIISTFCIVSLSFYFFSRQTSIYESLLEASNNKLDMLIRTICHDIANPLMVSQGHAQILGRDIGDNRSLESINRANKQIQNIVNAVKEMRKYRTGEMSVLIERVDLQEVFDECHFTLGEQLVKKNIEVVISFQNKDDRFVRGNQSMLAQNIFNNILTNAIKFSEKGSKVTINVHRTKNDFFKITIADSGIGIPEDMVSKIFEPGLRVSRLGTQKEKGTGFGLAIAKSYLKAMGGDINVKSVSEDVDPLNHGTEFEIILKSA